MQEEIKSLDKSSYTYICVEEERPVVYNLDITTGKIIKSREDAKEGDTFLEEDRLWRLGFDSNDIFKK